MARNLDKPKGYLVRFSLTQGPTKGSLASVQFYFHEPPGVYIPPLILSGRQATIKDPTIM